MHTVFGPNDEVGYLAARDSLTRRFERWLADREPVPPERAAEMAGDARLALDWKWSYGDGDGDLDLWRTGDVAEFLLEGFQRRSWGGA